MVSEAMQVGETTGSIEGKPSLALPAGLQPIREEREWGCTAGVSALPGWAKPNVPCDPAFRNITAGMGGVPITYRFAVEPGSKRTVVLGFCESYHPTAGQRPMVVQVEGVFPAASQSGLSFPFRSVPGPLGSGIDSQSGHRRLERPLGRTGPPGVDCCSGRAATVCP